MSQRKKILFFLIIAVILSISNQTSEVCQKDSDCQVDNHCKVDTCKHNSFFPFKSKEIIGLASIFLASAISNAGGIGGGTLFLPVLIIILHFYTHEAVPLSKIVIFTGSLISFGLNAELKHPIRKAKAIDYNLIILIAPGLLFGTILGVTLNKILPNVIIIFFLTIVLFYNTYKTTRMGLKEYKSENERCLIRKESENSAGERGPPGGNNNELVEQNKQKEDLPEMIEPVQNEIKAEIEKDNTILRWDKLKFVIIPFLVMVVLSLLRESKYIPKCSFLYWILFFSFFLFALVINFICLVHVQHEHNYRISIGFPYDNKDILWETSKCIKMSVTGLISGFIAGTIGIGGGVVLGPLLLGLGIYPVVSTVTTNFLVLLTSSSTSLQFILNGLMNFEYAIIGTSFSILGSYVGTKIVHFYFKKTGRESILIFALVLVIGSSAIILPLSSLISTLHDIDRGVNVLRFNSPCRK